jgi:hypothetical protein
MTLLARNRLIAERIDRPAPMAERLRVLFVEGKRAQLLAGHDAQGTPFAPLAASTLRYRKGFGPPLVPNEGASKLIAGYVVTITTEPAQIRVEAGWPGLDWVRYHQSGTRRMPQRDPGGFRAPDVAEALRLWKEDIFRGK